MTRNTLSGLLLAGTVAVGTVSSGCVATVETRVVRPAPVHYVHLDYDRCEFRRMVDAWGWYEDLYCWHPSLMTYVVYRSVDGHPHRVYGPGYRGTRVRVVAPRPAHPVIRRPAPVRPAPVRPAPGPRPAPRRPGPHRVDAGGEHAVVARITIPRADSIDALNLRTTALDYADVDVIEAGNADSVQIEALVRGSSKEEVDALVARLTDEDNASFENGELTINGAARCRVTEGAGRDHFSGACIDSATIRVPDADRISVSVNDERMI